MCGNTNETFALVKKKKKIIIYLFIYLFVRKLIYYFYYYYRAAQSSPSAGGPVPLPAENTQVPKNVPHSQPHATPVSPRGQQQPAKILQPVSYKDRDASSTPSPPLSGKALSPRGASKASKKSSKSKSKSKKGQKQKII